MTQRSNSVLWDWNSVASGAVSKLGLAPLAYGVSETCITLKSYIWASPKLAVVHGDKDVDVDIIFVHGFGGDARGTWTCHAGAQQVHWWNKDYLDRDVPRSRVLVYSYRSEADTLQHFPHTIREESKLLLECLEQKRRGVTARPLIFIAHGLGGLIVKAALVHAFESSDKVENYRGIFNCTRGVLFYGTPHQGTNESLGRYIAKAATSPFGEESTKSLEAEADVLALQIDRYKSLHLALHNFCFYERGQKQRSTARQIPEAPEWQNWTPVPLDKSIEVRVNIESRDDEAYTRTIESIRSCKKGPSRPEPGDSIPRTRINLKFSKGLREAERLSKSQEAQDTKDAEFRYIMELKDSEDTKGLCGPYTLLVLSRQARYYQSNSANDKALSCYRRIHLAIIANYAEQLDSNKDIAQTLMPAAHSLSHGAHLLGSKGQHEEAIRVLTTVQNICQRCRPATDKATLMLSAHIASFYTALGQFEEADDLFCKLLGTHCQHLDEADINIMRKAQEFIEEQRRLRKMNTSQVASHWRHFLSLLLQDTYGTRSEHWVSMGLQRSTSDKTFDRPGPSLMPMKRSFTINDIR